MHLKFPDGFIWGTSTAAAQIETASEHNWKGLVSKDGYTFLETAQHERRREEDIEYIDRLGQMYRCGVDWARLQTKAMAPFEEEVVAEYQNFFRQLNERGVQIMFVLHHFTHPIWFEDNKGWLNEKNIPVYMDYVVRCVKHFGPYVSNWNTFNEPNVYAMNGYILGGFPPHKKRYSLANRVLKHMGMAHGIAYNWIKEQYPDHPIGISLNTGTFEGKGLLGKLAAGFVSWWFMRRAAKPFEEV
ncbi:MAG: family 1 glycosylhydrolase, partial [Bacteroidota bacterium]